MRLVEKMRGKKFFGKKIGGKILNLFYCFSVGLVRMLILNIGILYRVATCNN